MMNSIRVCVFVFGLVSNVVSTIDENFCERFDSINGSTSGYCQSSKVVDESKKKWLFPQKWIPELLSKAKDEFRIDSMTNIECKRDFDLYRLHLQNQSIWAVRMMESSEWPSVGIYSGMVHHLGNWQECMLVSYDNIRGQYCTVEFEYDFRNADALKSGDSVWNALQSFENMPWKVNRKKLRWPVCVPASCSWSDVEYSLRNTLKPIFDEHGFIVKVKVEPNFCSTKIESNYTEGFYLVCALFASFVLLIVLFHIYDFILKIIYGSEDEKNKNGLGYEILKSFSLTDNYNDLVEVSDREAPFMYYMKIVYSILVISGHRVLYFLYFPRFNVEAIETSTFSPGAKLWNVGIYYSGFTLVDAFFMISGFITFKYGYSRTKTKGFSYVIESIFVRWARMILVFAVVMLFAAYVLPYMGDGPLWRMYTEIETKNCKWSFWNNFFALGNMLDVDKPCFFHSWYMSADIQLSILGMLTLWVVTRNEKLGAILTVFIFMFGTIGIFIIAYVNQYHPLLPNYIEKIEKYQKYEEFTHFYTQPLTRIATFFLGFGSAFVAKKLKDANYTFSLTTYGIIIVILYLSKFGVIASVPFSVDFIKSYDRFTMSFKTATLRTVVVIPDAIALCVTFCKEKTVVFHDSKKWVPAGRLLYCVYVVNVVIQFYQVATQQTLSPTYSFMPILWLASGDIIMSFLVAFVLYLTVQAPVSNLTKLITKRIFK